MRIVLDPGHGGADPGAVNPRLGLRESDLNLEYAMALAGVLRRAGHDVYLTRVRDVAIALADRATTSNVFSPALFLSIHCNAARRIDAHGFEAWTSPGQSAADEIATAILERIHREFPARELRQDWADGDPDRESPFYVLKHTRAPAVLLELGFVSNDEEAAWLSDVATVGRYANAIGDGVLSWIASRG